MSDTERAETRATRGQGPDDTTPSRFASGDPNAPEPIVYRVWLKEGRERSLERRHPWVYSGAVERIEALPDSAPGGLGEVVSARGEWLATAIIQPDATLVARALRFERGPIDGDWMRARVAQAKALRAAVVPPETDAYRLVNAEGDGLPGLIVDRYAQFLVVQALSAGMVRLARLWLPALVEAESPSGIVSRGDAQGRAHGAGSGDAVLWGEAPPARLVIREHGLRFAADLLAGQKTGFYLDQRENRRIIGALSRGRRMLNAFAYTNAFGVYAAAGGAASVVAVETSVSANELARENWALNGFEDERLRIVKEDAQRVLRQAGERYDLIVLDPPPFAKERGQVERAARAYKDLNLHALRCLAPGGLLATFSCSQHIEPELFQKIVFGASLDARVPAQWIARWGAGPDHPVHLDHPQGEYLKGLLLRAMA